MTAIPDTRAETVTGLLRRQDLRVSPGQWAALAVLTGVAWLGATSFIGQYRPNQVAQLVELIVPGQRTFLVMLAVAAVLAALGYLLRRMTFAHGSLIVAGFLAGHALYARLYPLLGLRIEIPLTSFSDGLAFAGSRLLWAVCVAVIVIPLWLITFARQPGEPRQLALGWGDWNVEAREFSAKREPERYSRMLITGYLTFILILFVLMQFNVGFRPIRTGALLVLAPAILVSAITNAAAEEFIFRGLIQPVFIRIGGIAAGLWMQGALFGLMHWGASVGVLAALPVSLGIGLGSVMWGKAALETRGLGWVTVAHALVDIAVMSAFFV
jgi:membrane protease YdiL (CAAX protease family)